MGRHIEELMAGRDPGDMPSPQEFRDAFDADFKESEDTMWEKLKALGAWVYSWITVIAAFVLSALLYVPPLLDVIFTNVQPLLPPEKAMAIMAAVGIVKGLCALVQNKWAQA